MTKNDYLLIKSKSRFGMIANMLRESESNGIKVDKLIKEELISLCSEMYRKIDKVAPGYSDEYYAMDIKEQLK